MSDDPICPRCGRSRLSEPIDGRPNHARACTACGMQFDLRFLADWNDEEEDDA